MDPVFVQVLPFEGLGKNNVQSPDAQLIVHKPYATIQDLPGELIADILPIAARGPASDTGRSLDWLRLQLVCRNWHAIACSTAGLWADIRTHPKVRIEWLRLCLERSAEAPLALLLVMLPEETYGELLPMLSRPENSRRIRVLRVRFVDVPRALSALCSLVMPSLDRLETSHESSLRPGQSQPIRLLGREHPVPPSPPRLHTLRLAGMAFPKNPAFYANLRSLAVHESCCSNHQLSLTDLIAVLRTIHQLEALDLSHFEPGHGDGDMSIADAAVYLPHLQNYTIHNTVPVMRRVNRLLSFPPTCTVLLSIRAPPTRETGPAHAHIALPDITSCMRAALQDAVAMTVSSGDRHFAVGITEPSAVTSGLPQAVDPADPEPPRAALNVHYDGWWDAKMPLLAFSAFAPYCPSDRLTSLTLDRVKEKYPAEKWAAVFRAYPALQRITLAEAHGDVTGVFVALAEVPLWWRGAGQDGDEYGDEDEDEDDGRPTQELLCQALRHIEVQVRMRKNIGLSFLAASLLRREAVLFWEPEHWEAAVGKLRTLVDEVDFSARHVR